MTSVWLEASNQATCGGIICFLFTQAQVSRVNRIVRLFSCVV